MLQVQVLCRLSYPEEDIEVLVGVFQMLFHCQPTGTLSMTGCFGDADFSTMPWTTTTIPQGTHTRVKHA